MQLVDVYRARVVDVSPESLVIETTGTEDKIDSLLEVLRPYGVIEMVRTGRDRDGARQTSRRHSIVRAVVRRPDCRRRQQLFGVRFSFQLPASS